jgi:hypothetical protein
MLLKFFCDTSCFLKYIGCVDAIGDYFNSEDTAEAAESLHELNEPVWAYVLWCFFVVVV